MNVALYINSKIKFTGILEEKNIVVSILRNSSRTFELKYYPISELTFKLYTAL